MSKSYWGKGLIFREALPKDSAFIFKVKKEALGPYIEEAWGWDEDFQSVYHLQNYEPSKIKIFSVSEKQNIGYVETEISENHIAITGIYILEQFQNLGFGTAVIEKTIKSATKKGLSVKLGVLKVNHNAIRLYERLGFKLESETGTHFKMKKSS